MKKFKWVVEFTVDQIWVEDGFDLTKERAEEMILHDLQHAYSYEVSAKIISAPPAKEIRKVQGYEN